MESPVYMASLLAAYQYKDNFPVPDKPAAQAELAAYQEALSTELDLLGEAARHIFDQKKPPTIKAIKETYPDLYPILVFSAGLLAKRHWEAGEGKKKRAISFMHFYLRALVFEMRANASDVDISTLSSFLSLFEPNLSLEMKEALNEGDKIISNWQKEKAREGVSLISALTTLLSSVKDGFVQMKGWFQEKLHGAGSFMVLFCGFRMLWTLGNTGLIIYRDLDDLKAKYESHGLLRALLRKDGFLSKFNIPKLCSDVLWFLVGLSMFMSGLGLFFVSVFSQALLNAIAVLGQYIADYLIHKFKIWEQKDLAGQIQDTVTRIEGLRIPSSPERLKDWRRIATAMRENANSVDEINRSEQFLRTWITMGYITVTILPLIISVHPWLIITGFVGLALLNSFSFFKTLGKIFWPTEQEANYAAAPLDRPEGALLSMEGALSPIDKMTFAELNTEVLTTLRSVFNLSHQVGPSSHQHLALAMIKQRFPKKEALLERYLLSASSEEADERSEPIQTAKTDDPDSQSTNAEAASSLTPLHPRTTYFFQQLLDGECDVDGFAIKALAERHYAALCK